MQFRTVDSSKGTRTKHKLNYVSHKLFLRIILFIYRITPLYHSYVFHICHLFRYDHHTLFRSANSDKNKSLIYQPDSREFTKAPRFRSRERGDRRLPPCFNQGSIGSKTHEGFLDKSRLRKRIRDYFGDDTRRGVTAARYYDNNYARGTPCG